MSHEAEFDEYADSYDEALAQGLAATGEDKHYFARGRIEWLKQQLRARAARVRSVLDYGCGTGSATPYFFDVLGVESVLGVDVSAKSLAVARQKYDGLPARFLTMTEHEPAAQLDLAFCSGVFHHIPPAERAACVAYVFRSLRPGGLFAFWENSPWNPGTRYVMSRCPFDADAIMLAPPEARRLLRAAGFEVLRTDFLFIFPHALRALRGLEPRLSRLPLGGQYMVLCRRP